MTIKEQILNSSLQLFNEFGSNNISTNQIAQKVNISPGTLYYYFRDKFEIIRGLLKQMDLEYSEKYYRKLDLVNELSWENIFFDDREIFIKYSFISTDISFLLKNDSLFCELYMEIKKKREGFLYMFFKLLQNQGYLLDEIEEDTIKKIIQIMYFNNQFMNFMIFLKDDINLDSLENRILPIYGFFTEKFKKKLGLFGFQL